MTAFLASVRDCAEAEIVLHAGADVIDCKDPEAGSLGALPHALVRRIVERVGGRCPVSATVGDLPMQADVLLRAASDMASTGVDYVKVGVLPAVDVRDCIAALGARARDGTRIIVVGFADRPLGFSLAEAASAAGLHGLMLDTADKRSGSLLDRMSLADLASFVAAARQHGLTVGLAGSLRAADVEPLIRLAPDLLGFRGALCGGDRRHGIHAGASRNIRELISGLQISPVAAVA